MRLFKHKALKYRTMEVCGIILSDREIGGEGDRPFFLILKVILRDDISLFILIIHIEQKKKKKDIL